MSAVRIRECVCTHDYQDQRYGKQKRVHTVGEATSGTVEVRCTVCKRTATESEKAS